MLYVLYICINVFHREKIITRAYYLLKREKDETQRSPFPVLKNIQKVMKMVTMQGKFPFTKSIK